MITRKETAWKKSKKFGDVHGGRTSRKIPDKILARKHSLRKPGPNDMLPILIEDNPSREFLFPVSGNELLEVYRSFPKKIKNGLTHIWMRKAKASDYFEGELPLACFVCGSGVRAIIMYPFPKDLRMEFGPRKPRGINDLLKYSDGLREESGKWILEWEIEDLRRYIVEFLFLHELGHHVDQYSRRWSKANVRESEGFADDFAVIWKRRASKVFGHIERRNSQQVAAGNDRCAFIPGHDLGGG